MPITDPSKSISKTPGRDSRDRKIADPAIMSQGLKMSDVPEFKFKLEIHTKGGTKHLLAVAALLLVLCIPVLSYIVYLHFH